MRSFNLLWNLYQLKRNEHKTKEQVKAIQEKKLHRLLKIAYEYSPYYHRTFKEAGITEENLLNLPLSAFPTMDKDILMIKTETICRITPIMAIRRELSEIAARYKGVSSLIPINGNYLHISLAFRQLTAEEAEKKMMEFTDIIDHYVLAMPGVSVNGVDHTANVIDQPERFHIMEGKAVFRKMRLW